MVWTMQHKSAVSGKGYRPYAGHKALHTRPSWYPPSPLRKHGRGPKSQVKTAVQRPPRAYTRPCMRDTRDSNRAGEPLDGNGEGLRMGNSPLSKAA